MARTRVYNPGPEPNFADAPSRHLSNKIADDLVSAKRARRLSANAIQLYALNAEVSREIITAAGYDHAVTQDPEKNFSDAWEKRESVGFQILQLHPPFRADNSVPA